MRVSPDLGRQYYRTRLDNDLSIGLEQGRIKHKQQYSSIVVEPKRISYFRYRHRSTRIIRSLAKKLQLNGQECWDSTRTREFCLFVYDYLKEISPYFLIRAGIRMGNEVLVFDIIILQVCYSSSELSLIICNQPSNTSCRSSEVHCTAKVASSSVRDFLTSTS